MTTDGNDVNIAVQGPSNTLDFYWQANGSPTWDPEQIGGEGMAFSAPSMTNDGNNVNIAVEGPATAWTSTGRSTARRPGTPSRSRLRAPPSRPRR